MKENLEGQRQEIKNLFKEFSKAYQKCIELSKQMNKELNDFKIYQQFQRQAQQNIQSYTNNNQLIMLKNKLFLILNQVLDVQQQLTSQRQKKKTFKEFSSTKKHLKVIPQERRQQLKSSKMRSSQICYPQTPILKKDKSLKFISLLTDNIPSQEPISFKKTPKHVGDYQVPIYSIQNNTNEQKLDSISKCIASLKRNMKMQIEANQKNTLKDFLKFDPQYMKIQEELERFKMREQQLPLLIQKQIQKGINYYLNSQQLIEEGESFKIIKIAKNKIKQNKINLAQLKELKRKKKQDITQIYQNQLPYQKSLYRYQSQKQFVGESPNRPNTQSDPYMKDLLESIESSVQFNQQKLRLIRSKRQKMFAEGSDIWDEIQKL